MNNKNVLIIGAGGVGLVVLQEAYRYKSEFKTIHIASKNISKCYDLINNVAEVQGAQAKATIKAHSLNAFSIEETKRLIRSNNINIVINVGPSFINMPVLDACIETNAAYIDTAIHEEPDKICEIPPWYANYEWKRKEICQAKQITAILGAGFDPGVVNAYAKICNDYLFDKIESIDILDVNAGFHGKYFATNFDPEINFREFTGVVYSWQNSAWQTNQMFEVKRIDTLPVVGTQTLYMTGHDELHSLSTNLDIANIRFWMSFSDHYINVFTVLNNIGLLNEQPVKLQNGDEVVPLKVVKALLPEPASLAEQYKGKTCIGNLTKGIDSGREKTVFIYNVADHETAYKNTRANGISYTAGVPALAAARLIANGTWDVKQMVNIEQLNPIPFLTLLDNMGLTTRIKSSNADMNWMEFIEKTK